MMIFCKWNLSDWHSVLDSAIPAGCLMIFPSYLRARAARCFFEYPVNHNLKGNIFHDVKMICLIGKMLIGLVP
jgi:hypothetical protein